MLSEPGPGRGRPSAPARGDMRLPGPPKRQTNRATPPFTPGPRSPHLFIPTMSPFTPEVHRRLSRARDDIFARSRRHIVLRDPEVAACLLVALLQVEGNHQLFAQPEGQRR